ncbi:unnamed protein product [Allacma fusca]|uniref:Uncharacterized protein n=1 Tax=Allacma fusca TaxID=39272 RepID=A0A8J2PG36_9HEXA|nr:unnamed protein product [Allacma fusca]
MQMFYALDLIHFQRKNDQTWKKFIITIQGEEDAEEEVLNFPVYHTSCRSQKCECFVHLHNNFGFLWLHLDFEQSNLTPVITNIYLGQ